MPKCWYHVDLPREQAEKFKEYIWEHGFNFEPSESWGGVIHIAVELTSEEQLRANEWLKDLMKGMNV